MTAATSTIGVYGAPQADGQDKGIVRATLFDANGYAVAGKTVSLATTGGAQITPATATTGPDGAVAFSMTDTTAETVTLTATGDGVALTTHPTLTFGKPVAAGATIVASPTSVVNNGTATTTVSVYLQDALGRPAAGKTVSLTGGGSAIISPTGGQTTTGNDGVATFSVRDFAEESVAFTAIDVTDGNRPVPGTATVNFEPSGSAGCNDTPPTPAAGSGLSISTFADGVPNNDHPFTTFSGGITFTTSACVGVETPAFDASGNVFVPSPVAGQIYEFGPTGGTASPVTALPASNFGRGELVGGLAFGKDGALYAARYAGGDYNKQEIVQLDPVSGSVLRVVANAAMGLQHFPVYMATDPLSGDLFVVDDGSGAGTGNDNVYRVANPASATPTLSPYANVGGVQTGLTFAPDGTMYVAVVTGGNINSIVAATATNSASPGTVTNVVSGLNSPFGVSVSATDGAGHATTLIVSDAGGNIERVDLTTHPATVTTLASRPASFSTGSALGPDGCLYFNDQDKVLKVTGVSTRCAGAGADTGPQLTLTENGAANPPTGDSVGFTATLSGVSAPQGTPIVLDVSGPNPRSSLVEGDASGVATFRYAGVYPGIDRVRARVRINGKTIASAPIAIHWIAGKHTSFLSLNATRGSGPAGQPVDLTASLSDVTPDPAVAVAGASVTLSLGGQSCVAVTDGAGKATCVVAAPAAGGLAGVTATFDGNATLTAAHASNVFATPSAPASVPPPVVAPAPAPAAPTLKPSPALSCTSASVVLINVFARNGRVAISGAAKLALAGRRAAIFLAGTKKAIATALIAKDGTFATTAPLPPKKIRNSDKARYTVTVGSVHSAALKLTRRMVVTRAATSAGRVRLAGTVAKPLLKGAKVTIRRRTSCHGYETVATVKVSKSGAWSASLPGGGAAVYRAQVKVREGKRTQTTYSLPIPV